MRPILCGATTDPGLELSTQTDWIGHHRHVRVTLHNTREENVRAWAVTLRAPGTLAGIYGAECDVAAASRFRIRGDLKTRQIPPKGSVTFGLLFE
jgi:hypothetical protein